MSTNIKNKKVFVAMSGGVDSSVAVALLKEQGNDVRGIFMQGWVNPHFECQWKDDRRDAARVAATLGIPFQALDFSREYYERVVSYLLEEYRRGRTPNPDVMCNKEIKFGLFYQWAMERGADYIATGHYARKRETKNQKLKIKDQNENFSFHPDIRRDHGLDHDNVKFKIDKGATYPLTPSLTKGGGRGRVILSQAKDTNKDQTYFLWTLTPEIIARTLFPIGNYTKIEVRELARKFGLHTADKKDSQGICFVGPPARLLNGRAGRGTIADFLRDYIPTRRGTVVTADGRIVGEHDGAEFFTIGQRHGLCVGGQQQPIYVAEKNLATNTLVVARGHDDPILYRRELIAEHINWISGIPPEFPLECLARIRYRQPLQKVTVVTSPRSLGGEVRAIFNEPQRAVAPGQSVVFYDGDQLLGGPPSTRGEARLLGGGIIDSAS